ncbi:MAG: TolC family protein [Crocosphaera sp.]
MLIYGVKVSIISLLAVFLTEKLLVAQTELVLEEESDVTKLLLEPSQRVSSEPRVNEILRMRESSVKSGVETELSTELEGKIDQDHRRLLQTNNPPNLEESLGDSETNRAKSPLNNLNQSGNSLMFPTKPKEVEITINKPLTLNEVIAITLQNNRELENARIEVEEIKARLIEQRSALYPSLRIDSRLNRRFIEVESADFVRGEVIPNRVVKVRETTGIFGVSLLYDIYTGGKRDGLIRRAELEIRDRQLQLEQIAEQVRFEAADNYYRLQNADAQVAIAEADVENTSRTLRDAKLLKQAGLGTKLDVLRADGDLEAANARLTRAIAEQRIARRTLAETMSLEQ